MYKRLKGFLVIVLLMIAAVVFVLQINHKNAWALICLYWFVLTIKNAMDVVW